MESIMRPQRKKHPKQSTVTMTAKEKLKKRDSRSSWIIKSVRSVSLPGLIAALWVASIYFYEHVWSTYFIREELSISTKAKVIELDDNLLGIHLEITVTNNGNDPIFNALNGITLYGFTVYRTKPASEDDFGKNVVSSLNLDNPFPMYSRYGVTSAPELLSFSPFLVPAYQFEPRQTNTFQKYFIISNNWDFVEAQVEILHTTKPLETRPQYSYRAGKRIGIDLGFPLLSDLRRSSITSAIPTKQKTGINWKSSALINASEDIN